MAKQVEDNLKKKKRKEMKIKILLKTCWSN